MPEQGNRPRIGLALGSGAARGLAFIGVLKVLQEEEIPIDLIAGTSIGALIGALYAAGVPIKSIEEVARDVDWKKMAQLVDPVLPTAGLIDGSKISNYFAQILPVQTFEELQIPLAMTATDVTTGETVILRRGNLIEALRAAIAFPGIFTPVSCDNRFLVDGGLNHPVPGAIARQLGADRVIGICAIPEVTKPDTEAAIPDGSHQPESPGLLAKLFNSQRVEQLWQDLWRTKNNSAANGNSTDRKPPNIFRVFAQSVAIMENRINSLQLANEPLDLLLRPDLKGINLLDFHRADDAISAGEQAARGAVDRLRKLREPIAPQVSL